jgi:hypothetical protein
MLASWTTPRSGSGGEFCLWSVFKPPSAVVTAAAFNRPRYNPPNKLRNRPVIRSRELLEPRANLGRNPSADPLRQVFLLHRKNLIDTFVGKGAQWPRCPQCTLHGSGKKPARQKNRRPKIRPGPKYFGTPVFWRVSKLLEAHAIPARTNRPFLPLASPVSARGPSGQIATTPRRRSLRRPWLLANRAK